MWQQGQTAGRKVIPALWSSTVLWAGKALGKRCRARTLLAATHCVLPEDTTRHGSGWKRKPARSRGDNCQPLALHVHTVPCTALTSCLLRTPHAQDHKGPLWPGLEDPRSVLDLLLVLSGALATSQHHLACLCALTPPPYPCSSQAPQGAEAPCGAEYCPQPRLGDASWKGATSSNILLHVKVNQVGQ